MIANTLSQSGFYFISNKENKTTHDFNAMIIDDNQPDQSANNNYFDAWLNESFSIGVIMREKPTRVVTIYILGVEKLMLDMLSCKMNE